MSFNPEALSPVALKRLIKRMRAAHETVLAAPVTQHHAQEIMAQTLGYANWHEAIQRSGLSLPTHEKPKTMNRNELPPPPLDALTSNDAWLSPKEMRALITTTTRSGKTVYQTVKNLLGDRNRTQQIFYPSLIIAMETAKSPLPALRLLATLTHREAPDVAGYAASLYQRLERLSPTQTPSDEWQQRAMAILLAQDMESFNIDAAGDLEDLAQLTTLKLALHSVTRKIGWPHKLEKKASKRLPAEVNLEVIEKMAQWALSDIHGDDAWDLLTSSFSRSPKKEDRQILLSMVMEIRRSEAPFLVLAKYLSPHDAFAGLLARLIDEAKREGTIMATWRAIGNLFGFSSDSQTDVSS